MKKINTVLTIAGSDSSGGAGIQADIKTISAIGCYAASVITALTAQNTQGVQAVFGIPAEFVHQQIDSVFNDLSISAVKIGMLLDEKIILAVAQGLLKYQPKYIILDPVMIAKNGQPLLKLNHLLSLKTHLIPHVTLLTPNIFEAEKILASPIQTIQQQEAAARTIGQQFKINVLLKGGHLQGEQADDVVYLVNEDHCQWFYGKRIQTHNTHGTGCTLSAAIAAYLTQGYALVAAISAAKTYLANALVSAQSLVFGAGCGPVDHFYFLREDSDVILPEI